MNEYQILMHERSVNNLLADRKTQTRRVLKPKPPDKKKNPMTGVLQDTDWHAPWFDEETNEVVFSSGFGMSTKVHRQKCPYGGPGSLLYVRESWRPSHGFFGWGVQYRADGKGRGVEKQEHIRYLRDKAERTGIEQPGPHARAKGEEGKWAPSIHMPKWASRIWLRVKDVRVERVQSISVEDMYAEGIHFDATGLTPHHEYVEAKRIWKKLWNDTHSHQLEEFGWEANPWVWCISFEVVSTTGRPRGVS